MKKGFTLVEILAVFVVLGIISMITVPAIGNVIHMSKEKAYDKQIELIINASRSYMTNNSLELPDNGETSTVNVCQLEKGGYLKKENISNPIYENGSSDIKKKCKYLYGNINVTNTSGKFTYTYADLNNCTEKNNIEKSTNICD
ncbi:MAG: type II secretion system protein [Bacilli bacterium]|nr:type II secretion system protein [Bacilli bacterium]